jgi:ketosteroid isomerase-like protein
MSDADSIRRTYEVWNESGPAAVTDQFWAADAVYRGGPGWPNAGVYRGRAAALARMQSLIDLAGPIEVRSHQRVGLSLSRLSRFCIRVTSLSAASAICGRA